jgi:hypothetical protein
MKKVLFVFLFVISSFTKANSQITCSLFTFDNVTILPYHYTLNDTLKVVIPFHTSSASVELWRNVNIHTDQITISACYLDLAFAVVTNYLDTIVLGILPEGCYNLTLNAYCSHDTICTYADTTTLTQQFCNPDTITSINKMNMGNFFEISPNPFTQSTQITLPQTYHNIVLAVCDIQGKLLAQQQYKDCSQIQLNRNQLSNGLYFLKLTLDDKEVETGKIVIRE